MKAVEAPPHFASVNPATAERIACYKPIGYATARSRIFDSGKAQLRWRRLSVEERVARIRPLIEKLAPEKNDWARMITMEMGKPIAQSLAEIDKCTALIEHYCTFASDYLKPVTLPGEREKAYSCFQPLGTILGVLPWNFPVWQVVRVAVPTLLAGNAFVFKQAPNVQGCAALLGDLFRGLEGYSELCQNLPIPIELVRPLIADPGVHGVTFTGSSAVGSKIAGWTGAALKPVVLELGGSDPYVVLENADLELAARHIVESRMYNSGQSCTAAKRIIVLKSVGRELVERIRSGMAAYQAGDPMSPDCRLGPMARDALRMHLQHQVRVSVDMGAHRLLGGSIEERPGYYFPATLLLDAPENAPVEVEEVFGPVASISVVRSHAEAVERANQTQYGLGASVFTRDIEYGEALVRDSIRSGNGTVNGRMRSNPGRPFGGVAHSGFGRELGAAGIRAFTNSKTIVVS